MERTAWRAVHDYSRRLNRHVVWNVSIWSLILSMRAGWGQKKARLAGRGLGLPTLFALVHVESVTDFGKQRSWVDGCAI